MPVQEPQKLLLFIIEPGGYPNSTPRYELPGYGVAVTTRMHQHRDCPGLMFPVNVLHWVCNKEKYKENNMKYLSSLTVLVLFLLTSLTVTAADIQVRVFERGGKAPLAGVAVCLGTPARIGQFGAGLTDGSGNAIFNNVPRASILVTASRDGYKAEQKTMVSSTGNRMLVITLPTGGGGPRCPVDETATRVSGGGLGISRFAMSSGAAVTTTRNVTLDNVASGHPTQYRASEMANFRGAGWRDYTQAPAFQLSAGPGKKIIYFQVRRHASLNGAMLETLSPVRKDSIVLQ